MRDLALGGEAVLQLPELVGDVRNRRVQLAGDEVPLRERPQNRGQRLALARDELEKQEKRDHARVGLVEVAEVVVPRDLAAEDGALLAHAVLDVGVADTVDQRYAAGPLD